MYITISTYNYYVINLLFQKEIIKSLHGNVNSILKNTIFFSKTKTNERVTLFYVFAISSVSSLTEES